LDLRRYSLSLVRSCLISPSHLPRGHKPLRYTHARPPGTLFLVRTCLRTQTTQVHSHKSSCYSLPGADLPYLSYLPRGHKPLRYTRARPPNILFLVDLPCLISPFKLPRGHKPLRYTRARPPNILFLVDLPCLTSPFKLPRGHKPLRCTPLPGEDLPYLSLPPVQRT
jgi:hypothetical protein